MFRLLTILLTVACIAGGGSAVAQALPQIPDLQQNQIPAPLPPPLVVSTINGPLTP
jgi:hypothetical protein